MDYTRGVFQSIGFKEFHNYLLLTPEERMSEIGRKKFEESVNNLKIATRRYSRKQFRWISNRFLARVDREVCDQNFIRRALIILTQTLEKSNYVCARVLL